MKYNNYLKYLTRSWMVMEDRQITQQETSDTLEMSIGSVMSIQSDQQSQVQLQVDAQTADTRDESGSDGLLS